MVTLKYHMFVQKGARRLAENYRGLSIGLLPKKRILHRIIINRLQKAYEDILAKLSTDSGRTGQPMMLSLWSSPTAAYDSVPRDFMFRILNLRTIAKHLIAILQKTYEGTTASITGMKAKFDADKVDRNPLCKFNYYFYYVLKVAANAIDEEFPDGLGIEFDYNIPHLCSNREQRSHGKLHGIDIIRWILHADDVVKFFIEHQLLNIINNTCKWFGLSISFKKTKTQVFYNEEIGKKETLFSLDGNIIENVQKFVYLGKEVTTEQQTSKATAKFNELHSVLTDHNVNIMATRTKLLEACVRSCLSYSAQACLPEEVQMKKLEVCWFQCLRNMVRGG